MKSRTSEKRRNFSEKMIGVFVAVLAVMLVSFVPAEAQVDRSDAVRTLCKTIENERWLGLYLYGGKVGWMRQQCRIEGTTAVLEAELEYSLTVMGRKLQLEQHDRRAYELKSGDLVSIEFSTGGGMGKQSLKGSKAGKGFRVEIQLAGQVQTKTFESSPENLVEISQAQLGILAGEVQKGWSASLRTFDPNSQQVMMLQTKLVSVEEMTIQGVKSRRYVFDENIPALSLKSNSIYDGLGRLMFTRIGGMIEAKWENREEATRGVQAQDFLQLTMLTPDKPIRQPKTRSKLTLRLTGMDEVPEGAKDERQHWSRAGTDWRVTIHKEKLPVSATMIRNPSRFKPWLEAQPDIQSEHPDITAAAMEISRGQRGTEAKVRKILEWLDRNIARVYSPDFSNALDTYRSRRGDCGEFAALFVALARAMGIPSRPIYGMAYLESGDGGRFGYHAWVEVWMGRWVTVDPIWQQFPVDATHLALSRGDLASRMSIAGLITRIRNIRVD